jgi:hypothetical protein
LGKFGLVQAGVIGRALLALGPSVGGRSQSAISRVVRGKNGSFCRGWTNPNILVGGREPRQLVGPIAPSDPELAAKLIGLGADHLEQEVLTPGACSYSPLQKWQGNGHLVTSESPSGGRTRI